MVCSGPRVGGLVGWLLDRVLKTILLIWAYQVNRGHTTRFIPFQYTNFLEFGLVSLPVVAALGASFPLASCVPRHGFRGLDFADAALPTGG